VPYDFLKNVISDYKKNEIGKILPVRSNIVVGDYVTERGK
jgi:hypothetical protein